jgi:hypothetical protein
MSIVAVMMVKNESDIIESCIRHNLTYFDRIAVIDNASEDKTQTILKNLAAEGLPLDLFVDRRMTHEQSSACTEIMRNLAKNEEISHSAFLDSDEFISADKHRFRTEIESDNENCRCVEWLTYVPTPDDDWNEADPVRRITRRRSREPYVCSKIIVPRKYFTSAVVGRGNHYLELGETNAEMVTVAAAKLAHIPLRSCEQLLSKALIGELTLSMRPGKRSIIDTYQWHHINRIALENGMQISRELLCELAKGYATNHSNFDLVDDPVRTENPPLKFTADFQTSPLERLYLFAEKIALRCHALENKE